MYCKEIIYKFIAAIKVINEASKFIGDSFGDKDDQIDVFLKR